MKNTYRCILAGIILFSLLLAACNPKETYTVDATPAPTGIRLSVSAWDELVNAARKEGEVMVYASELGAAQNDLKKAFWEKFGIAVDFTAGRPQETLADVHDIVHKANSRQGTLGQLINSPADGGAFVKMLVLARETIEDLREQAPISIFVNAIFATF